MLSLALILALEITAVPPEQAYEELQIEFTGGDYNKEPFKYRLLKPAKIDEGKKYPLVLFLHGAGERGTDNVSQLKYLPAQLAMPNMQEKYPCFVLAPQCRPDKKWVEVPWGTKESEPQTAPGDQMQCVVELFDKTLKENPIDTDRVYLTGLSMGGYGSWDLSMRMPERFAAVVPICGGGDERGAAKLVNTPLWAWHGDADNAVPVERSRTMIDAIKKAGGNPKYSELKAVGHNSWTPAYESSDGVLPWMFGQRLK